VKRRRISNMDNRIVKGRPVKIRLPGLVNLLIASAHRISKDSIEIDPSVYYNSKKSKNEKPLPLYKFVVSVAMMNKEYTEVEVCPQCKANHRLLTVRDSYIHGNEAGIIMKVNCQHVKVASFDITLKYNKKLVGNWSLPNRTICGIVKELEGLEVEATEIIVPQQHACGDKITNLTSFMLWLLFVLLSFIVYAFTLGNAKSRMFWLYVLKCAWEHDQLIPIPSNQRHDAISTFSSHLLSEFICKSKPFSDSPGMSISEARGLVYCILCGANGNEDHNLERHFQFESKYPDAYPYFVMASGNFVKFLQKILAHHIWVQFNPYRLSNILQSDIYCPICGVNKATHPTHRRHDKEPHHRLEAIIMQYCGGISVHDEAFSQGASNLKEVETRVCNQAVFSRHMAIRT